jgi:hypothetical protein
MKKAYDLRSGVRAHSCMGLKQTSNTYETPRDADMCQFKKFEESIRSKYSGIKNNAQLLFENCNKKIRVRGRTFFL